MSDSRNTAVDSTASTAPDHEQKEPAAGIEQVEADHPANCGMYGRGHAAHHIGIRVLGGRPWGWRDGVVTSIRGLDLQVRYLQEDGSVSCWHHRDLSGELAVGSPVRVYESSLLDTGHGWISVRTEGGLGAVEEPDDPELWAAEISTTITDLHAGRGIVIDGPDDE